MCFRYTPPMLCLVAVAKLLAISITVTFGFRGGFIFPLMFSGTCLGLAISTIPNIPFVSTLPPVMLAMPMAAGDLLIIMLVDKLWWAISGSVCSHHALCYWQFSTPTLP